MLRKLFSLILCSIAFAGYAQVGSGGIKGTVTDKENGEPIPFVNIVLEKNGLQVTGGSSDFDGKFFIKPIPPGNYDLKAKFVGYQPVLIKGIVVKTDGIALQNVSMSSSVEQLETFEVIEYTVPLISPGDPAGQTITKEDIGQMATRSATGVAQAAGGVFSKDDGSGDLNIRGAREDANFYYIDGIKVRGGNSLPKAALEQVSVITGGVPAQYGDVTGGVVSITTRGPSRQFGGSVELLTSGFRLNDQSYGLDPYAYNLLEFSATGPLLSKKSTDTNSKVAPEPLVGFFIAGNVSHNAEPRPSHLGWWKVKDDVLADLYKSPLRLAPTGQNTVQNAEFLNFPDFENVRVRPNVATQGFNIQGKLDFNTGKTTNLTVGGNLQFSNNPIVSYTNSMFNWSNYGENLSYTWRTYARFVQRFESAEPGQEQDENAKASVISNAYYSIQADYTNSISKSYDQRHRDNLFRYGHVGEFKSYQAIDYSNSLQRDSVTGQLAFIHETFIDTLIGFTPKASNPLSAAFTQNYYDIFGWGGYDSLGNPIVDPLRADDPTTEVPNDNLRDLLAMSTFGGLRNGDLPNSISNIWNSPALIYNSYGFNDNKQFRFTATGSADIGDHAISVGFEYEQRVNRSYSVNPARLWEIGRLAVNEHIRNIDKTQPTIDFFEVESGRQGPRVTYPRLNAAPGDYSGDDPQFFFDYNLRNALNLDPDGTDWIDLDALDPDDLKITYFSADELLNEGSPLVNYFGYDHHGNDLGGRPTFDDFFTERDEFGNYTRPIDAFRPIYMAGYIQDKFAYRDLFFNIGVRIDRYDANQQVLQDPYVLFPTVKAGEAEALDLTENGAHPDNIGDDYVVYVDDVRNPTAIRGYRSGTTWYSAEGAEISDGSLLSTAGGMAPLLVDKENTSTQDITSASFRDFAPITIPMPRIAFSFPISEDANFTAHYDVLTRTPNSGGLNRLVPTDYLFLESNSNTKNNPALRPERTIDYEAGFQQVLTKTSSIKIAAFYREFRDQVQLINVSNAYPREYRTYGNVDFGTVKGMTFTYDLRRTGNVQLKASYTLQFAEGTGSNTTTASALIRAGRDNLRVTNPLNFDQRHTFTGIFDYRYRGGKEYNGPVVTLLGKERQLFARSGANFQFNAGSGTPYSGQTLVTGNGLLSGQGASFLEGSINGARLPWNFRVDARIDKSFTPLKEKRKDKKNPLELNVYLQVLNLLNTKNVVGVYRATGNPTDDGYLADARFQQNILAQNDEQSFRELYNMKISNPFNFNLPRRTRLGLLLTF